MREHDVHTGPRGLRLRLCSWGPPAGRPTLILHGYLEQAAAWDEVACALDRRVVAPDHRGHGLSEHVGAGGWYYFWDYVRDVDAVIDHIGGPVDLIGHSMGGTIATLLAATRPEKVRRLVLIEGLGMPDTRHEAMERARQFLDARTDPPRHGTFSGPEEAAARLQRASPRLSDARALALATRVLCRVTSDADMSTERWTWTWDPLHRGRSPVPFNAELHTGFLAALRCPTLLIDGADSPWRPPDGPQRARAIAQATSLTLPNAGHMLHHDAPLPLAAAICRFLDAP
jgi:pimeloyl-ACP methyl ester carboxylesterase